MKKYIRFLPWCFVAIFATEIVAVMMPKKDGEFHWRDFGRLPVLLNGRVQPFDTVARDSLLQIRSTGDVPLEEVPSWQFWHHPKKLKSTEWLLEVMARPEIADTRPIFLIHLPELLGELKLDDKGVNKSGLRYYTFEQLKPVLKTISEQSQEAEKVKPGEQTAFQRQVAKLANAVMLYQRLKVTLQPEGADNFAKELRDFMNDLTPARAAAQASEAGKKYDREALERIAQPLQDFQMMAKYAYPMVIPPMDPSSGADQWKTAGAALMDSARQGTIAQPAADLAVMMTAYRQNDSATFNKALDEYRSWLQPRFPKAVLKGGAEFYYNDIKAFLHAIIIYIFAFLLAGAAVLSLNVAPNVSESLRRSAFYLIILAGFVHTFGLVFRMILAGRPPVTNLYSSAIFIGWGTMILGLVLERIYRAGIGSLVASFVGFITLLIAQNLAIDGDTMEMVVAVLDNNFWLATHVVVITLGYASTFCAGFLAILYIFLGLVTPTLSHKLALASASVPAKSARTAPNAKTPPPLALDLGKALSKMVYAIICFATLFSFVGTVLGGIWADQSWGRFWGWDPKENGALLIVLWNALILHARWGGLVRERGIMNLAVFGNIITSFSWFGVNMLQIGLHSYGFMEGASKWLLLFVASQLLIIAMGLLPLSIWRSFRVAPAPVKPVKGGKAGAPQPAVT